MGEGSGLCSFSLGTGRGASVERMETYLRGPGEEREKISDEVGGAIRRVWVIRSWISSEAEE